MNFKQFLTAWIVGLSSALGFVLGYDYGYIALVYAYAIGFFNSCIIIKLYNDGCH